MHTHRKIFAAALVALAAVTTGCSDKSADATSEPQLAISRLAGVSVSPALDTVAVGSTAQLKATARDRRGRTISGAVITWSTATPGVATVSSTGLVKGVAAGTVKITAIYGSYTSSAQLLVTGAVTVDTLPTPVPVPTPTPTTGRWVSGYYIGYQRSLYPETAIDFSLMTHILVGAIQTSPTGVINTDFYIDAVNGPAMAKTIATRAHAAGRKAILMLGGDGARANLLSATSSANMSTFVTNLITTMNTLGYDGIDVDWEPIAVSDQPQLLDLLKRLKAAKPNIILTVPLPWAPPVSSWYAQMAAVVDQVNIMSYGMAGNWGGWDSWHGAALRGETATRPTSVSKAVSMYTAVGVPAAKIGVGIGFYGSCWRGVNTMGVPLVSGADVYAGDNSMSYTNIMNSYYSSAAYKWDATASAGYLSFASATGPQSCNMVSYEDVQSITAKGAYVKSAGLGGAILWTINQAYFPNAALGSRDPLDEGGLHLDRPLNHR